MDGDLKLPNYPENTEQNVCEVSPNIKNQVDWVEIQYYMALIVSKSYKKNVSLLYLAILHRLCNTQQFSRRLQFPWFLLLCLSEKKSVNKKNLGHGQARSQQQVWSQKLLLFTDQCCDNQIETKGHQTEKGVKR